MNDKLDLNKNYKRAKFNGKIHVIDQDKDIKKAISLIKEELHIGFDTETKPAFKKGEVYNVSLLQLSTEHHAVLFRLHYLNDFSLIKEFFENEENKKIGVAIRDDIKALQKAFDFTPLGFIELADLAKSLKLKNLGLKGMSEEVLNLTLSKRAKLSNWEAKSLSREQLEYAATDAWIGREIYLNLKNS